MPDPAHKKRIDSPEAMYAIFEKVFSSEEVSSDEMEAVLMAILGYIALHFTNNSITLHKSRILEFCKVPFNANFSVCPDHFHFDIDVISAYDNALEIFKREIKN